MKKFLLMFTVLGLTIPFSSCATLSKIFNPPPPVTFTTEQEVAANTQITADNFKKTTTYVFPIVYYKYVGKDEKLQYMPNYKEPSDFSDKDEIAYYLTAAIDSKNNTETFIFTFSFFSDYDDKDNRWEAWELYDSNGNALVRGGSGASIDIAQIAMYNDTSEPTYYLGDSGRKYVSTNNIKVLRKYLETTKDSGIVLRATVLRASYDINPPEYVYFHIPSYYIQAILNTVK